MCGIFFAKTRIINKEKIFDALDRRGHDMMGYSQFNDYHLFHTRLSILDLSSKGIQPMFDEDKRFFILYNGEIYNFQQLKKRIKGHKFKSNTDTEVLLELYKQEGVTMLDSLKGMFAFVIGDLKDNSLFIARDQIGIKPLYYVKSKNKTIFSSNIGAIINCGAIKPKIDSESIREFMCFRQNFRGSTLFNNIKEFLPGYYMKISDNKVIYKSYWNIPQINKKIRINKQKIFNLFYNSIKRRLIADVPIGSFLSGGLDSSFLTSLMRNIQSKIHTYDARVLGCGESKYARIVASYLRTKHHSIPIFKNQFIQEMDDIIEFSNYPLSVPNEIAISKMSKSLQSNGIGVVLSGEGADELFGGYDQLMGSKDTSNRVSNFIEQYNYFKGLSPSQAPMHDYFWNILNSYRENIYEFFLKEHIRGLLKRLDNATMFHSIEGRVPYLDIDLVEYLCTIPVEKRLSKTILKDIAKGFLPARIIKRKKIGFPMPLEKIFRMEDIKKMLKKGKLQKYIPLSELLQSLKNRENRGYKMWMVYNMEKWLKTISDI